jgi:hypothetical protein
VFGASFHRVNSAAWLLANVLGAKQIGQTMEVPTEMLDRLDLNVDGGLGVVATP